jgi:hypothetical protein
MSTDFPPPAWHEDNPWADSLVYVPLQELAALLSGGTAGQEEGASAEASPEFHLAHWSRHGNALDAYLLPGSGQAGIRLGSAPEAYLSPHVRDRAGFEALVERHRDAQPSATPPGP